MRACKNLESTSTPQMILDTVTYLVRAIEVWRLFGRACQWRWSQSSLTVVTGGIMGAIRLARGSRPRTSRNDIFHQICRAYRYKGTLLLENCSGTKFFRLHHRIPNQVNENA